MPEFSGIISTIALDFRSLITFPGQKVVERLCTWTTKLLSGAIKYCKRHMETIIINPPCTHFCPDMNHDSGSDGAGKNWHMHHYIKMASAKRISMCTVLQMITRVSETAKGENHQNHCLCNGQKQHKE